MSKPPRIPYLPRERWNEPGAREVFGQIHGPDNWEIGAKYNVMQMMANHPKLAVPYYNFSKLLLQASSLEDRLRELITLKIAHLWNCEYEWAQHEVMAKRQGITDAEIAALRTAGSKAPEWSPLERLAIKGVEELHDTSTVSDATWKGLAEHFSQIQLVEFLFTVGHYVMLGMVLNGLQVEPESAPAAHKVPKLGGGSL